MNERVDDEATPDVDLPEPEPLPPLELRDGVPAVIDTRDGLDEAIARLAAGHGPVAVDAERAGGYRYSQRAYLVQFRREGSGTLLVDPIPFGDLRGVQRVLADVPWVVHAASQDLPCLREIGLEPAELFDTELAARLLGHPRVGLATLLETQLGVTVAKEHSAADWSTRPLPEPWLRYAALDVEVLLELRALLAEELDATGKTPWAEQEFAHVRQMPPAAARVDPWRRTSGLHQVRTRRGLAIVRELWVARDGVARRRDVAPGRVLPDPALVAAALAQPDGPQALAAVTGFTGRGARRHLDVWAAAVARGLALPEAELPATSLPHDGPPPPRAWPDRDPAAAARLTAARSALAALAEEHRMPVENLLSPDLVRRLCWTPPGAHDVAAVAAVLQAAGARRWQIELTGAALAGALDAVLAS